MQSNRLRDLAWLLYAGAACLCALAGAMVANRLVARAIAHPDLRYVHSFIAPRALWPPYIRNLHEGWPVFIAIVVTLGLVCWLSMRACRSACAAGRGTKTLLIVQLASYAALTAFAFTISGDVYLFILWGRVYGVDGANPYAFYAPATVADPLVAGIARGYGSPPVPDNYGPLWTLFEGAIARVEAHASLAFQVWTQRFATIASALATTIGLAYILRKLPAQERIARLSLFAFQPLMMYEAAVESHIEALMLALAVWSFALVDELPIIAGVLLGAAISVKFLPAIVLPFLFIRTLRRHGWPSAVLGALAAAAILVVTFQPLWLGGVTIEALQHRASVISGSALWLIHSALEAMIGHSPDSVLLRIAGVSFLATLVAASVGFARSLRTREIWRTLVAAIWSTPGMNPEMALWLSPALISADAAWRTYAWTLATVAIFYYAEFLSLLPPRIEDPFPRTAIFVVALIVVPILAARIAAKTVGQTRS